MGTELLDRAKHLSIGERIELVEAIWDSVAEEANLTSLPLSAGHREELDRRLADLEANPSPPIPWEALRSELETDG